MPGGGEDGERESGERESGERENSRPGGGEGRDLKRDGELPPGCEAADRCRRRGARRGPACRGCQPGRRRASAGGRALPRPVLSSAPTSLPPYQRIICHRDARDAERRRTPSRIRGVGPHHTERAPALWSAAISRRWSGRRGAAAGALSARAGAAPFSHADLSRRRCEQGSPWRHPTRASRRSSLPGRSVVAFPRARLSPTAARDASSRPPAKDRRPLAPRSDRRGVGAEWSHRAGAALGPAPLSGTRSVPLSDSVPERLFSRRDLRDCRAVAAPEVCGEASPPGHAAEGSKLLDVDVRGRRPVAPVQCGAGSV